MGYDRADFDRLLSSKRDLAASCLNDADSEVRDIEIAARDANADDEHDPEGSTIAFERARAAALRAGARKQLEDLDAALERLATGTFGVCERCGSLIAKERLEAIPTARRCRSCAPGEPRRLGDVDRGA